MVGARQRRRGRSVHVKKGEKVNTCERKRGRSVHVKKGQGRCASKKKGEVNAKNSCRSQHKRERVQTEVIVTLRYPKIWSYFISRNPNRKNLLEMFHFSTLPDLSCNLVSVRVGCHSEKGLMMSSYQRKDNHVLVREHNLIAQFIPN